ncbi:LysR family transcriptional regulator [Paraburkholderia solisilvae]|uniref:HTH-type transcriptional regulator DmlR n=1 Tax=Paraburkholderia solisilvae TaxID=624376 RepID=A0A6J5DQW4_9BURK|nr:LysR family transcriptional regulator [Paraburkholderia solisilvae]CAB3756378.1 HTH-type transcriptional regulator DmlR [Paraburkholderia solisilvae]
MDRFTSMSVFVRVVDNGGFAAAADVAGISAAMVGNHIRALEAHLGARLLNRTTRQQSLTEVGRAYYEQCVSILSQMDMAETEAREMMVVARGVLRVTAPVSFGSQCLAPAISQFLERTPNVQVELTLSDRVVELVNEGFDVAVRIGHLPASNLIARQLVPYRMVVCAAPSYLARRGIPRHPDELIEHECLSFGFHRRTSEWRFYDADGEGRAVQIGGRLTVNHGPALRMAALAGAGILMQPELLVADDLRNGSLVRLFENERMPKRPMHLVYQRDSRMPLKVRHFVNFVLETWPPEARLDELPLPSDVLDFPAA